MLAESSFTVERVARFEGQAMVWAHSNGSTKRAHHLAIARGARDPDYYAP